MNFVGITLEFNTNLSFIFEQNMLEILNLILVTHSCCLFSLSVKRILSDRDAEKKIQTIGIW